MPSTRFIPSSSARAARLCHSSNQMMVQVIGHTLLPYPTLVPSFSGHFLLSDADDALRESRLVNKDALIMAVSAWVTASKDEQTLLRHRATTKPRNNKTLGTNRDKNAQKGTRKGRAPRRVVCNKWEKIKHTEVVRLTTSCSTPGLAFLGSLEAACERTRSCRGEVRAPSLHQIISTGRRHHCQQQFHSHG